MKITTWKIELFAKAVVLRIEEKNNNNTLIQNEQPKFEDVKNNENKRTLTIGFSNCGKTYLMNLVVVQQQEPIFIMAKSLNQYPNITVQTSDETQPLENYEHSIVVFPNILLWKQENNIDLFFTRGRHAKIDIYNVSQSFFNTKKHYSY